LKGFEWRGRGRSGVDKIPGLKVQKELKKSYIQISITLILLDLIGIMKVQDLSLELDFFRMEHGVLNDKKIYIEFNHYNEICRKSFK
jgi:hypothetical protein